MALLQPLHTKEKACRHCGYRASLTRGPFPQSTGRSEDPRGSAPVSRQRRGGPTRGGPTRRRGRQHRSRPGDKRVRVAPSLKESPVPRACSVPGLSPASAGARAARRAAASPPQGLGPGDHSQVAWPPKWTSGETSALVFADYISSGLKESR